MRRNFLTHFLFIGEVIYNMKHLTKFELDTQYHEYAQTSLIRPNVSLTIDLGNVYYKLDNGMGDYYTKGEVDTLIVGLNSYVDSIYNKNTSELNAISGHAVTFASKTIPIKMSQLENNNGFLKQSDVSKYLTGVTETDPTVPSWAKSSTKPSYTASEVGTLSSSSTLDNIPDGTTRKLSNLVQKSGSKVLSTNDYTNEDKSKLASLPASAATNVIEVVKVNGTALPVSSKVVNVTIPTAIGSLTNDSGFITTASTKDFTTTGNVKTQIEAYGFTNTQGTITDVIMNGSSKKSGSVVNLGTVVTSVKINSTSASLSSGKATISLTMPTGMPSVSASDNGKLLKVVNGAFAASN